MTLDVDRHYIGIVTATTHQEKGIITLESKELNEHSEMHEFIVHSPLFDVYANMPLYSLLTIYCTLRVQNRLTIFKTYMCSVIFELFHFLGNRERNGLVSDIYFLYSICSISKCRNLVKYKVKTYMSVYCQILKK